MQKSTRIYILAFIISSIVMPVASYAEKASLPIQYLHYTDFSKHPVEIR